MYKNRKFLNCYGSYIVMSITLDKIYSELLEIKKRLDVIERVLLIEEEAIDPAELTELKEISKKMKEGERIPWSP